MDNHHESNKIKKKVKRLHHVVYKETGVTCVSDKTKILVICNAGLVNGLTEEDVIDNFNKYGIIDEIILIPGKSCAFVSFRDLESAVTAYENCNGKLCIAQDKKPVYLSFANEHSQYQDTKSWSDLPNGLVILHNFITEDEELMLLNLCKFGNENVGSMKNRQVKHYGYEFRYDNNNIDKKKPLLENIPLECNFLWEKLKQDNGKFSQFHPDQLTVNYYSPGQGIPHHIDTHSAFESPIISLSLGSTIIMEFKKDNKHNCVLLPRRSLAIMSDECRYAWTHGITPRKFDVIKSNNGFTTLRRETRVSYTFRKILQGECSCNYTNKCDSYIAKKSNAIKDEEIANKLEQTHVYDVYESIANHFSDTRHKPWPNVLNFVESFQCGSVLVDIGCGNGKYLGHNKEIFELGGDRSFGLIDVCQKRNFNVFNANCLNIPLRNNIADAVISIAVIHHMANENRRLKAIEEIARILKPNGEALIYVWAKEQHKDKVKSMYIKQDRKNRKEENEINNGTNDEVMSVAENLTLPVHTNRTEFKYNDLLVPWKLKEESKTNKNPFLRFYHVFEEGELEKLCSRLDYIQVIKSYYDQGNWCVILKKIN